VGVTDRKASRLVARGLSELGSPAVVVIVLPVAVGLHATGYRWGPTLGWAAVIALFASVLPMAFVIAGARRGRWDGHHVRDRAGRFVPLLMGLASAGVALAVLLVFSAPRELVALLASMVAVLIAAIVITRYWKVSLHAAVAAGAAATVVLIYGPWWWLLAVPLAAVCWSRVRLADHTPAQVVAGGVLGPLVGGAVFLLLR
jgi:membrane-associated phospholipid phosphatase